VQVLTHGTTLDSTYWDFATGYSYINAATAAGYATFSYDRLGVGSSAHPDPIQAVQAALQVEILHQLVVLLRAAPDLGGKLLKNVVGVGHSAGSTFTQAVSAKYPNISMP
jgi:pimeloyl-ACP methyl ester carboxylesterase